MLGGADERVAGSLTDLAMSGFLGASAADRIWRSAAASLPGWAVGRSVGVSVAARAGGRTPGSLPDAATSRSSAVFAHRQCKSFLKVAAVKPPVLMSANTPQASRMVATIVVRRTPSERRCVATAHTTKATPRVGIAKNGN